jgi:short-subunit dehydrogenase
VDLNLKAPLYGMRVVGEIMARQGGGQIVNVASLAGLVPTPGTSIYSAAKGGLRLASIAAAVELRAQGVYVTTISPDVVDTPLSRSHLAPGAQQFGLINSGVKLSVADVERAFWRAMRDCPFEINLPRRRGWLAKLGFVSPAILNALYGPLRRRGERRLERERQAAARPR